MTQTKVSRRPDYTRLAFAAALVLGVPACTMFGTKDDAPQPPPDVHANAGAAEGPYQGARLMSNEESTLAEAVAAQRGGAGAVRSSSGASRGSASGMAAPAASIATTRGTTVQLAEGAPTNYVVKKGDTLWAISAMYLRDPWLWPELWKLNPQIQNPHLIFPGDQVSMTFEGGQAQLSVTRGGEVVATTGEAPAPAAAPAPADAAGERESAPGAIRVSPKIRTTPLEDAVTFLPIDVIRPFLTQTGILDPDIVEEGPYIFGSVDNRVLMGPNDRVYARRIPEQETHFTIVRLGRPYEDPVTDQNLGYAAMYIGEGQVELHGDPGIVRITSSKIEALKGDYLVTDNLGLPTESFQPRPPRVKVDGQIIDVVGGVENIGTLQVVVLNKGTADGLQPGDVLLVLQNQGERRDAQGGLFGEDVVLPDARTGEVMVFRTYNRLSYALVMRAESEIRVGAKIRSP